MIALALILAMQGQSAVDAERAFNHMAQTEGQWAAFRAYATDDAVMFLPQPSNAQAFLKDRKEPAIAVQWWPAESYVACDGTTAVNTGPWVRPSGSGYFTTVWHRQGDGRWKWSYDAGDALAKPRALPEQPKIRRAACGGTPRPPSSAPDERSGGGASRDGTLIWRWEVDPDGARRFTASLWTGRRYETVVEDRVAAPQG
ncbi:MULTISPECIES: hypothetical protein [unclassified Sphingomonas]|uniref:hypothetical protein n=1 Tax=unclassified Sphingomonas TaxID=196159 RepID=UPI0021518437|nr:MULTISPECIES: hypothetical protein [unclassified Sphingomonas]MCR5869895.1 hypothetical protein [Sphingomonas sp. J344]UUX98406.1 hypothetical protein LRS08_12590 [Sphingomonas sp. J315]